MFIENDVTYAGVNDRSIDLFEGQYAVPEGMAYNSYIISDEKTAVMDSVDKNFTDEWLGNICAVTQNPDYLIVQHMEPDHSGSIAAFMDAFPEAVIVSSGKAFDMMRNFYGENYESRRIIVSDGDSLNLGRHRLTFIAAPMVHWPEVIVTYDSTAEILFSADGFGKFGALDTDEDWACEARRYYFGIVGKYGVQVQKLLSRLSGINIKTICPLHGPVLTENIGYYIDLYNIWSSYGTENEGVAIFYTSVYGNTEKAAKILAEMLNDKKCPKVVLNDLARSDMAECVEDAFRYGKIVLATTTYNSDIFPYMKEFINHLTERGFKNKTVALIENGSWAPVAATVMTKMLGSSKNIVFAENKVRIISAVNEENKAQLAALADELC